jgi:hypothetical protein
MTPWKRSKTLWCAHERVDFGGVTARQVRFDSGGSYPELKADLPAATGDMLRRWENFPRTETFVFPTQFYPFVTTLTALQIGNVGRTFWTARPDNLF